jgi:hypothetical protein
MAPAKLTAFRELPTEEQVAVVVVQRATEDYVGAAVAIVVTAVDELEI